MWILKLNCQSRITHSPSKSGDGVEHITWLLLIKISPTVNDAMNRHIERTEKNNADSTVHTPRADHSYLFRLLPFSQCHLRHQTWVDQPFFLPLTCKKTRPWQQNYFKSKWVTQQAQSESLSFFPMKNVFAFEWLASDIYWVTQDLYVAVFTSFVQINCMAQQCRELHSA